MKWSEVKKSYPNQWIIIEALHAYMAQSNKRKIKDLIVVEKCESGKEAIKKYQELHKAFLTREFYFIHTSKDTLEIEEKEWLGIRM